VEHLSTFGFNRDPFSNEPRLSPPFDNAAQQEALTRLSRAVLQARGLSVLTAEGGAGKTMLVRQLLESMEEEMFEACMLVPVPGVTNGRWVLDRFAQQLGVEEPAVDSGELLGQVYEQLAIVREDGRHAVLIIDEAQVLAECGALSELRGLLNLEYEDRRLLSLVLVGLPGLDEAMLSEPAMDRVEVRASLPCFDAKTATAYLRQRVEAAGGRFEVFEPSSVDALIKASGGNPRRLNVLADNALFEAHLGGHTLVAASDVERAAADLGYIGEGIESLAPAAAAPRPIVEPSPQAPVPVAPMESPEIRPDALDVFEAEPSLDVPESSFDVPVSAPMQDPRVLPEPELLIDEVVAVDIDSALTSSPESVADPQVSRPLAAGEAVEPVFEAPALAPVAAEPDEAAFQVDSNSDSDDELDAVFAEMLDD